MQRDSDTESESSPVGNGEIRVSPDTLSSFHQVPTGDDHFLREADVLLAVERIKQFDLSVVQEVDVVFRRGRCFYPFCRTPAFTVTFSKPLALLFIFWTVVIVFLLTRTIQSKHYPIFLTLVRQPSTRLELILLPKSGRQFFVNFI